MLNPQDLTISHIFIVISLLMVRLEEGVSPMRPAKMGFPVRKGFTLVELLIVTVIIGILAGSLLLVFGSARNRSTSTRVISDLMTLKRATVIFFYDNGKWPEESDYEKLNSYMIRDVLAEGWGDGTRTYAIQRPDGTDSVYAAARVGDEYGPEFDTTEAFRVKFMKDDLFISRVSGFESGEKAKKA